MKKIFFLILLLFLSLQFSYSQTLSEADKERDEIKTGKEYFPKSDECRKFINSRRYQEAEVSCKNLIPIAERFPKTRYLEKRSAYEYFGIALLRQNKTERAISYLNKSLEISKGHLDDTDSETGEVYYFLGQSYHQLGKVNSAQGFYIKAENIYRAAFKNMDDDELRKPYSKAIKSILETHLILLKDAGMKEEAAKIEKRLAETKIEFANFLEN